MMKNIMQYICLLAMMLVAVPMMGQDYLTVVLKDGTKKQYFAKEGIKIYLSKTDKSGKQHGDYQSQCIEFGGYTAKHPLSLIDSILFTKFNEAKAYESFSNTLNAVSVFSNQYSSIEDAKEHISELQSNPSVEYVNVTNDMITVKIKGFNKLYILDNPQEEDDDEDDSNNVKQSLLRNKISNVSSTPLINIKNLPFRRVVIANGRINEPKDGGKHQTAIFEPLAQKFRECGIDAIASDLTFENATENLFDCDILIMYAHGGYGEGVHLFTTSTIVGSANEDPYLVKEEYRKIISEQKNKDDMATYVHVSIPKWTDAYIFPTIDEEMLNYCYSTTKFNSNNSIVFMGACHILDQTNSFADFFMNRGAACFMGYDGRTSSSQKKIEHVFSSMLNGISDIVAVEEKFFEPLAKFHNIHRDDAKAPIFLFNTISRQVSVEEARSYYLKNGKAQLTGVTTMWDKESPKVEFGFLYGKDKDNLNKKIKGAYNTDLTDDEGNFVFTADVDLSEYNDGTFHKDYYYYQAYTYDGEYYNLGEIQQIRFFDESFTPITSLTVTEQATTMDLCEVKTIEYHFLPIDATNKTMEWESSDPTIVEVDQNGIVTALKSGTATITVRTTDGSNLSATCTITVTTNGGPTTDKPEVDGTSVTFGGHHTCTGDYLRGFVYWEEGHEDSKSFINSLSTGIAFIAKVNGLKENTTYYCQVVCTHYGHNFYGNIVKFTIGSTITPEPTTHEYVDLGLSVKWATCNVGATSTEKDGDYYAWAETKTKTDYSWDTLFDFHPSKYTNFGGKTLLDEEDDAAYINLGSDWRMPTKEEYEELMDKCTAEWTNNYEGTGVPGYIFTSRISGYTDKSIFFPASGYKSETNLNKYWTEGRYYSKSLGYATDNSSGGYGLYFNSSSSKVANFSRKTGLQIRAVYNEAPASTAHESVDLGLSVKWATCNVDATSPEEYGGYYAWGETEEKSVYIWETYQYFNELEKSCMDIGNEISGTSYDVAHVKWGGNWRMPTKAELDELLEKCTWKWTRENDVNGYKVTASNGKSIFLPATGYRVSSEIYSANLSGCYQLGTLSKYSLNSAYYLTVSYKDGVKSNTSNRYYGFSVRPVCQ